jgi:hypothetical protein
LTAGLFSGAQSAHYTVFFLVIQGTGRIHCNGWVKRKECDRNERFAIPCPDGMKEGSGADCFLPELVADGLMVTQRVLGRKLLFMFVVLVKSRENDVSRFATYLFF